MSDCEGLGTGCGAGGWHNQNLSYMFDFFLMFEIWFYFFCRS